VVNHDEHDYLNVVDLGVCKYSGICIVSAGNWNFKMFIPNESNVLFALCVTVTDLD